MDTNRVVSFGPGASFSSRTSFNEEDRDTRSEKLKPWPSHSETDSVNNTTLNTPRMINSPAQMQYAALEAATPIRTQEQDMVQGGGAYLVDPKMNITVYNMMKRLNALGLSLEDIIHTAICFEAWPKTKIDEEALQSIFQEALLRAKKAVQRSSSSFENHAKLFYSQNSSAAFVQRYRQQHLESNDTSKNQVRDRGSEILYPNLRTHSAGRAEAPSRKPSATTDIRSEMFGVKNKRISDRIQSSQYSPTSSDRCKKLTTGTLSGDLRERQSLEQDKGENELRLHGRGPCRAHQVEKNTLGPSAPEIRQVSSLRKSTVFPGDVALNQPTFDNSRMGLVAPEHGRLQHSPSSPPFLQQSQGGPPPLSIDANFTNPSAVAHHREQNSRQTGIESVTSQRDSSPSASDKSSTSYISMHDKIETTDRYTSGPPRAAPLGVSSNARTHFSPLLKSDLESQAEHNKSKDFVIDNRGEYGPGPSNTSAMPLKTTPIEHSQPLPESSPLMSGGLGSFAGSKRRADSSADLAKSQSKRQRILSNKYFDSLPKLSYPVLSNRSGQA